MATPARVASSHCRPRHIRVGRKYRCRDCPFVGRERRRRVRVAINRERRPSSRRWRLSLPGHCQAVTATIFRRTTTY